MVLGGIGARGDSTRRGGGGSGARLAPELPGELLPDPVAAEVDVRPVTKRADDVVAMGGEADCPRLEDGLVAIDPRERPSRAISAATVGLGASSLVVTRSTAGEDAAEAGTGVAAVAVNCEGRMDELADNGERRAAVVVGGLDDLDGTGGGGVLPLADVAGFEDDGGSGGSDRARPDC
jgi:hypothetical protein